MFKRTGSFSKFLLAAALLAGWCATHARALNTPQTPDPNGDTPKEIRDTVGITEHLGATIPLNLTFMNELGETTPLSTYFGHHRPILLQMGYFDCPMLCSQITLAAVDAAKAVNLRAGADFDMLFISINSTESPSLAAMKKQNTLDYYGKPEEAGGFHFLVGRPDSIDALAETVGFKFAYMPDTQQYAHPAVLFVLTPEGKIARYIYPEKSGSIAVQKFNPQTLRLSLVEAASGKIGNTVDRILLFCFHYDQYTGKYSWAAVNIMRAGGILTMCTLGGTMLFFFRREHKLGLHSKTGQNKDTESL